MFRLTQDNIVWYVIDVFYTTVTVSVSVSPGCVALQVYTPRVDSFTLLIVRVDLRLVLTITWLAPVGRLLDEPKNHCTLAWAHEHERLHTYTLVLGSDMTTPSGSTDKNKFEFKFEFEYYIYLPATTTPDAVAVTVGSKKALQKYTPMFVLDTDDTTSWESLFSFDPEGDLKDAEGGSWVLSNRRWNHWNRVAFLLVRQSRVTEAPISLKMDIGITEIDTGANTGGIQEWTKSNTAIKNYYDTRAIIYTSSLTVILWVKKMLIINSIENTFLTNKCPIIIKNFKINKIIKTLKQIANTKTGQILKLLNSVDVNSWLNFF